MAYTKVNWKSGKTGGTLVNSTNLNQMDKGIYDNSIDIENIKEKNTTQDEKLITLETSSKDHQETITQLESEIEELKTKNTEQDTLISELESNTEQLELKNTEQDEVIAELESEITELKDNVLTNEVEGTFIHAEDSATARILSLESEGNCKQVSTTGKNLFSDKHVKGTLYGNYTYNESTYTYTFVPTETNVNARLIALLPKQLFEEGETYTIKVAGSINRLAVGYATSVTDTSHYNHFLNQTNVDRVSFQYSEIPTDYVNVYLYNTKSTLGTNWTVSNIQLEKGSTATDYEQYTGGQATPNPDYPQEIEVVEGTIQNKFVGKNILDYNNIRASVNGLTNVINEDGSITTTGIPTANNASLLTIDITNILEDGETYNYSMGVPNKFVYIQLIRTEISSEKKNYVSIQSDTLKHYTFKVDKSQYTYVAKIVTPLLSDWGTESLTITNTYQLEKAPVSTEFEPYQESNLDVNLQGNFMAKIGDVKDTLRVENGRAILTKRVGKVILDGSENTNNFAVTQNTANENYYYIHTGILDNLAVGDLDSNACSHFKCMRNIEAKTNDVNVFAITKATSRKLRFMINKTLISEMTSAAFINWLAENPVTVYYVLATPYEVDLGEVTMPKTYEGVTNVSLMSNLESNMKLKYVCSTNIVVNNLAKAIVALGGEV